VISVNLPEFNKFGSVGKPLIGNEVKIDDDGEILVKGDLVMKGYYKDEEETRRTIVDGWLHTGDLGEWIGKNQFRITDRKKSLFKSSGGKYVAPTHIEDIILQVPYVDQILVVGNEKMYVTALIVADLTELRYVAQKIGIEITNDKELITNDKLLKKIEEDINEAQKNLSSFEKIRKFTLLEKSFSIEDGELTPTMKIKRKFVEEKYKQVIDKMYHKV
jgi:long-chain acyl-CoA synthetase